MPTGETEEVGEVVAIFEVDARPHSVHPVQPAADNFGPDAAAVLIDHLESVLGEPLFTLARGQEQNDPRLTALDARGALVVIDIFQTLDAAALMHALRNAGRLSRCTPTELAQTYGAGPEQFVSDFSEFRASTSSTAALAPAAGKTRLVIMCSAADPDALDALEFLAGPQIEVRRVRITRTGDGRRFIDASPLVPEARRPQVSPTPVRPVTQQRTAPNEPEPVATQPEPAAAYPAGHTPQDRIGAAPPRMASPPSAAIPVAHDLTSPVASPSLARAASIRGRTTGAQGTPTETGSSVHAAAFHGRRLRSRVIKEESTDTNEIDLSKVRKAPSGNMYAAAMAYGDPGTVAVPAPRTEPQPRSVTGPQDDRLAAVTARLPGPTTLIWTRLRRGERFEATLDVDGTITLPDGSRYADPGAAAAAASGSEGEIDGWRTWRVGDTGPTLSELAQLSEPAEPAELSELG